MEKRLGLQVVLEWMATALGAQVDELAAERLPGATSSVLYRIRLRAAAEPTELVLRLFTNGEWLRQEPDLVRHEAASVRCAAQAPGIVPTPRLVAADETGEICGAPAILMTALPGRVDLQPTDQGGWLSQMARTLAEVHRLNAPDYRAYTDLAALRPPGWSSRGDAWERAIRLAQAPAPPAPSRFIHRDYHPCNLLWEGGRISGVVDWVNACQGPAGIDVGHCRANLAALSGLEAADRFLTAYRAEAGSAFSYHPYWDLVSLLDFLPDPLTVYPGWIAFGVTGLTERLLAERLEAYLLSLLGRW